MNEKRGVGWGLLITILLSIGVSYSCFFYVGYHWREKEIADLKTSLLHANEQSAKYADHMKFWQGRAEDKDEALRQRFFNGANQGL